jgi:DNA-binding NarL/FixJ family response regulator
VRKASTLRWEKGRLIVEIHAAIRVPIEIEPITSSAVSRIKLTPREQQTLIELLKSSSNKEIGSVLNLSERTIKFHVSSLLRKFGLRSRIELVMLFPNGLKVEP